MVVKLALLVWTMSAGPAYAAPKPAEQAPPALGDGAAPGGKASRKAPEAPVAEPAEAPARSSEEVIEGIWDWLERLDGEVITEQAAEEVSSDVEAILVEQAFTQPDGGVDVPRDFYEDPARALQGDPLFLDKVDPNDFNIPIVINDEVISRLRLFLGPQRKYIQKWLERKSRYEPMILEELAKAGLPSDVIYLSMIESGFNPYAYSSAAAAGLWQFMPATGQHYGLRVDWWEDQRRDPELATQAAMRMLGELHTMFGDWHLAFAAYNTGPGRVRRLVREAQAAGQPSTYWDLLRARKLHPETAGYVPKIIAAAIIGHYPERYGFTGLVPHERLEYDTVKVDGAVDVEVLARCAGVDEETFRNLNPALRRYATPENGTVIRVPKGGGETFTAALDKVPPEERVQVVRHVVRRGETLSIIAGRYGVSSAELARVNGISNPNRIAVGQWLVVPTRGGAAPRPEAIAVVDTERAPPAARPEAPAPSEGKVSTHKVQRGETLGVIAGRYGVSVSDLQRWNGIPDARHIEVGQVLQVKGGTTPTAAAPTPAASKTSYTVRSGDTLSEIADRFNVGLSELQRWNRLSGSSRIYVGQKLVVYGDAPASAAPAAAAGGEKAPAAAPSKPTTYTVRSGDTLSEIASRFGTTIAALQSANGISDPRSVHVGQVLKLGGGGGGAAPEAAWVTHVVKRGESLGLIAERYGVSVGSLRSWNGLSGSTIYPGQKLKVKKG